jgi:hypothetical protein
LTLKRSIVAVEIYNDVKDADWVTARHAALQSTLTSGAYVEQIFDAPGERPVTGNAWAPTETAYPMVIGKNAVTGEWEPIWQGEPDEDEQTISGSALEGFSAIRLCAKFAVNGQVVFDEIRIDDLNIERAQIPRDQRDKFVKIILQTKPMKTWAIIVADWT